jgi:hypothetical protein
METVKTTTPKVTFVKIPRNGIFMLFSKFQITINLFTDIFYAILLSVFRNLLAFYHKVFLHNRINNTSE